MSRILIVTDSLGAPRNHQGVLAYEDTWIYAVKNYFEEKSCEVIAITHNGLHSTELVGMAETKLIMYSPDMVIIQCGLVDCAPRVLKDREILLSKILRIGKIIHFFAHKYHAPLSRWRNISLTTPQKFDDNMRKVRDIFKMHGSPKIVQIPIAPACPLYCKKSPIVNRNIQLYNDILKKHADLYIADFSSLPDKIPDMDAVFMDDGHHLNKTGHHALADIIIETLNAHSHISQ